MMHSGTPGAELQAFHVPNLRHRNMDGKEMRKVWTPCRHDIWLFQRNNQVGRSQLPTRRPYRCRWEVARITFRCTVCYPFLDKRDLGRGQMALPNELTIASLRFPWRH